jgi:hypothetical protein
MVKSIKILRMLKNIYFKQKYNYILESYLFYSLKNKRIYLYSQSINLGINSQTKNKWMLLQPSFSYY